MYLFINRKNPYKTVSCGVIDAIHSMGLKSSNATDLTCQTLRNWGELVTGTALQQGMTHRQPMVFAPV
jgi:hypothetical protein